MNISVYAHIDSETAATAELREGEYGRHAVIKAGGLAIFIYSREQLLELASRIERVAQQWEGSES